MDEIRGKFLLVRRNLFMLSGKPRGFTFLEVLVVMTNISIILAIAVPAFISWVPRYQLKAAVRDLQACFYLCKMKAIKENADCVIRFDLDRYTVGGETFPLPVKAGVQFGAPTMKGIPRGAEPGNGITFPQDKATFKCTGRPVQWGTVYLKNDKGNGYAISVGLTGHMRIWKWENGDWAEQKT
jgi:prepilin-type N-terminal cleavage/methylation domain-containing protein